MKESTWSDEAAPQFLPLTKELFKEILRFSYAGSSLRLKQWLREGAWVHTSFSRYHLEK